MARLMVQGASPLAWRVRVDADALLEEARLHADRQGQTWVESLDHDVRPPSRASAAGTDTADPVAELRALIAGDVVPSESFKTLAREIAEDLRDQLPREARDALGADKDSFNECLAHLINDGAEDVLAHLHSGGRDPSEAGA